MCTHAYKHMHKHTCMHTHACEQTHTQSHTWIHSYILTVQTDMTQMMLELGKDDKVAMGQRRTHWMLFKFQCL